MGRESSGMNKNCVTLYFCHCYSMYVKFLILKIKVWFRKNNVIGNDLLRSYVVKVKGVLKLKIKESMITCIMMNENKNPKCQIYNFLLLNWDSWKISRYSREISYNVLITYFVIMFTYFCF